MRGLAVLEAPLFELVVRLHTWTDSGSAEEVTVRMSPFAQQVAQILMDVDVHPTAKHHESSVKCTPGSNLNIQPAADRGNSLEPLHSTASSTPPPS